MQGLWLGRQGLGRFEQLFGCLHFTLGMDHLGTPRALGLGLLGDRPHQGRFLDVPLGPDLVDQGLIGQDAAGVVEVLRILGLLILDPADGLLHLEPVMAAATRAVGG